MADEEREERDRRSRRSASDRGASARQPRRPEEGRRRSAPRSDGGDRGAGRSSGAGRSERPRAEGTSRRGESRPDEPALPDDLDARELPPAARRELSSLSKNNAELVARHLAMAARVIDTDPARASAHAQAAVRRAGRVAVARETAGVAAYAAGDFALALRELRTYRRISGRDDQIALIVDSERGMGRPERALAEGAAASTSLPLSARAALAIAMSGARLDLGQTERALRELDRVPYPADQVYAWSADLAAARATVLEDLGREDEAARWRRRSDEAAAAWERHTNPPEQEVVFVEEEPERPAAPPRRTGVSGAPAEPTS